jgi:uncharacterized membrane protein
VVVAIYLICHDRLPLNALFATLVVTALVFAVARPVAGVGIVTHRWSRRWSPPWPRSGWAAISLPRWPTCQARPGPLVGPGLLNLLRVRSLRAPMVSIGGAGTFDGVFLTGLVAVLLASV